MTDAAIANARARLVAINEQREGMRRLLVDLDREAVRAERFIAEWEQWAADTAAPDFVARPSGTVTVIGKAEVPMPIRRPSNPPKEKVAEIAELVLYEAGHPLSRSDLYKGVQAKGIDLKGADPLVVFSTMLWRMKAKVPYYKGIGYWPTSLPTPAGYRLLEEGKLEHWVAEAAPVLYPDRSRDDDASSLFE